MQDAVSLWGTAFFWSGTASWPERTVRAQVSASTFRREDQPGPERARLTKAPLQGQVCGVIPVYGAMLNHKPFDANHIAHPAGLRFDTLRIRLNSS